MKFTIKNYRSYVDSAPLVFEIEDGFTAIIGSNNSGKSSILRFFHEFKEFFSLFATPNDNIINSLKSQTVLSNVKDVYDQYEVFSNLNERDLSIEIDFHETGNKLVDKVLFTIEKNGNRLSLKSTKIWCNNEQASFTSSKYRWEEAKLSREVSAGGHLLVADFSNLFNNFILLRNSMYVGAFRNALNVGESQNYFGIEVGTTFIKTWDDWQTGGNKYNNSQIVKVISDIKRLFSYDSLEISASNDKKTLHILLNGKPYKLNELGSGLAEFIIVLGNAAVKTPSFIFIDEPESHLHPSLQLDFLTMLASYTRNGIVFATHSIGLARSSAKKIYSVVKNKDHSSSLHLYEKTPKLAELLGEMSFSTYRELGFEQILLVEGPTEIKTVQQFLKKIKKEIKFLILPLGGASLINGKSEYELSEFKRVAESDKISVLIDSEISNPTEDLSIERKNFQQICKKLNFNCHILERRAMENYFTKNAIQELKSSDKYRALGPFDKLQDVQYGWGKDENWRIAQLMDFNDIKDTDLGKFLASL